MKVIVAGKNQKHTAALLETINEIDASAAVVSADNLYNLFALLSKNKDAEYAFVDFYIFGEEWRRQLKRFCDEKDKVKVVFYSDIKNQEIINYLFTLGSYGFIPTYYKKELLSPILYLLFNGCAYIPPSLLSEQKEEVRPLMQEYRLPDGKALTPRQIEVLGFLGKGLSNKQIAFEMDVSEATVKLHINALLKNLDVNNRTQAVISAQRFGFL